MSKALSLLLFTFILIGSFGFVSIAKCFGIVVLSSFLAWLLLQEERCDKIGIKIGPGLFIYLIFLTKEIFLSATNVCKAILLTKRAKLKPIMSEIKTKQTKEEAIVLLGNSITLTPGTITVDASKNSVMIHAINRECISGCFTLDSAITKSQK